MTGVRFADGTSSTKITQPFGYLSVTSRDATSWNVTNSFGFPQNETIANIQSLTTNTVLTGSLYSQNYISTPYINLLSLDSYSTSATYGAAFVSTLVVGPPPSVAQPNRTDPGYSAYIQGNLKAYSNVDIDGSLSITGSISTGSNFVTAGSISTLGSFGAYGDIITLGNIFAPQGAVLANNLEVRSNATFGGDMTFSNAMYIASSLLVQNLVSSVLYTTSTLQVQSSISIQDRSIVFRGTDLYITSPLNAPAMFTTTLQASSNISTTNLYVANTIAGPTVSSMTMANAVISNPAGSLLVSSIAANTATIQTRLTTSDVQTSSISVSSILLSGNIVGASPGYLTINSAVISSISSGSLFTNSVNARAFQTTDITVSEVSVQKQITMNNLSTFNAASVRFLNTNGSISTGSIYTANTYATSTLTLLTGQIQSPTQPIRIQSPNIFMDRVNISSLTTSTLQASTLTATRITMGATPTSLVFGPYYTISLSTNMVLSGGPGDYLRPWFASNVKPPGIGPGDTYDFDLRFELVFPGTGVELPGHVDLGVYTLFPNGEPACVINGCYNSCQFPYPSLYGLLGSNQTQPYGSQKPFGVAFSPEVRFYGTMAGNSAISITSYCGQNPAFSVIDQNNVMTINNGAINFPYFLNGITINNSLNDMSVRTLYYYGSLNFASDPRLKEEVEEADSSRCYSTIQSLPLRRYKYLDDYISTFKVKDRHRLGFLATDLEPTFPKSITMTTLPEMPEFANSTVRTIDTQQIEMTHIGATKELMRKVTGLYETLAGLTSEISSLKNLGTR
jgi:hypothetical protein